MKNKLYLVFALCLLAMSVNAQTIYHYKLVAKVNPNTQVKTQSSGTKMHLIFQYGQACICDEEGKIYKENEQENSVNNLGYGVRNIKKVNGSQYHLDFVKTDGDMKIYHSLYTYYTATERDGMQVGYAYVPGMTVPTGNIKTEKYLYVSSDRSRINFLEQGSYSICKDIQVYELYDTDEVGNMKKATQFDPNNPSQLY